MPGIGGVGRGTRAYDTVARSQPSIVQNQSPEPEQETEGGKNKKGKKVLASWG